MSKRILNALYQIQNDGLLLIDGYVLGCCGMLEEKIPKLNDLESFSFREGLLSWPLFRGSVGFPISVESVEIDVCTQYIDVSNSNPPYKNEYLGLRWHLLHHLINYFEDLDHE